MKVNAMFVALVVGTFLLAEAPKSDTLEAKVREIAKTHKGKIAVAMKNLETGESFAIDGDEQMATASLIKMQIMVEAYWQSLEKKVDLNKTLTLTKDDKVPGSGILTSHFSDGATFSLRDAVRMMIVFSDNTATNMVLDQVGIENVNARMDQLSFPKTRINAKVYKGSTTSVDPAMTKKFGLGSTTANESLKMLELLHTGKVVDANSCKTMIDHMKANDDKEMMVRFLPEGTSTARKTGAVSNARTEAGILYVPTKADKKKTIPVALCVLTNENEDKSWSIDNAAQVVISKIAKEVFFNFHK
jgi:beta-lactamase class A